MENIIFDFDGTLADSFGLIIDIAHSLTKHPKLIDSKEVDKLRNMELVQVAKELSIPTYKWPILLYQGRKEMHKKIREVKVIPGIKNTIQSLHKKGLRLFVISSNSNENVEYFLKNNQLDQYFSLIKGGVGLFKKAKYLNDLMLKNNLKKSRTVYIGDEPRDIKASRSSGIKCIAVCWGFNSKELLNKFNPDYLANYPKDLLDIIK